MVTIGMLGAIGGEAPLALLVDQYGWRQSMFGIGFIGLFLAFLIFIIVKDQPAQQINFSIVQESTQQAPMLRSLLTLLKNNQLWGNHP